MNVLKEEYETEKIFNERLMFIKKFLNDNPDYFKEAERLSKVYIYIKYYECKYIPELYFKVKKYL